MTVQLTNSLKMVLKYYGKMWSPKIIAAFDSVDPDVVTDYKEYQTKLAYAVQHCDPDSGMLRVSGTLRGLIEKTILLSTDYMQLATVIVTWTSALEKYE